MSQRQPKKTVHAKAMVSEVRMRPKVVFWVVMAATAIAFMSFSMMFVTAGFRNGWW